MKDEDFLAKVNQSNGVSFEEFHKARVNENDLVFPIFTDYKLVSLD